MTCRCDWHMLLICRYSWVLSAYQQHMPTASAHPYFGLAVVCISRIYSLITSHRQLSGGSRLGGLANGYEDLARDDENRSLPLLLLVVMSAPPLQLIRNVLSYSRAESFARRSLPSCRLWRSPNPDPVFLPWPSARDRVVLCSGPIGFPRKIPPALPGLFACLAWIVQETRVPGPPGLAAAGHRVLALALSHERHLLCTYAPGAP